jgi:hypothetical protein
MAIGTGLWAIRFLATLETFNNQIFDHDFCIVIGTDLWARQPYLTIRHFDHKFCMAISRSLWAIKPSLTIK